MKRLLLSAIALLSLAGCMESGTALPRVSTASAVQVFKQTCLAAPFNLTANRSALSKVPGFAAKEPITLEGKSNYGFESTQVAMSGDAGNIIGASCGISYTPADDRTSSAATAGLLLMVEPGVGAPLGRKNGGMVSFDYKGGKLVVTNNAKTGQVSLSLIKL